MPQSSQRIDKNAPGRLIVESIRISIHLWNYQGA